MKLKTLIPLIGLITLSLHTQSYAQTITGRQFSADTAKLLLNIYGTSNAYPEDLLVLDKKLKNPNLTKLEKSNLLKTKGSIHYELNQISQTIQAFENAIAAGGLSNEEDRAVRLSIAQLWISQGEYARGAEMLEQWGKDGNLLKSLHIEMLMQAWVQSDNYERALPWAEKWYNEANPKERKHYDLMNFLYNNLGHPSEQTAIIKDMIERWPEDKSLRDSLASMYANDGREEEAFKVQQESYRVGLLKSENDIKRIVQYHAYYKLPYDAAIILEKEMEAERVSKSLENTVWLSKLYQDAGYDELAKMFFLEAIDMSDEQTALAVKKDIETKPDRIPSRLTDRIPEFQAPKVNRGNFKIQVADRDAQPLVRTPPITPKDAKKSGHCKVRFDVDKNGQPKNIVATFCTEKTFEKPAVKSVKKWKYNPKIIDDRTIGRSGVENRVQFRVKDEYGDVIPE